MAARTGSHHHHAGPHLPIAPAIEAKVKDIADPARGARVPRCLTCGHPGETAEPLMEFALLLMPGAIAAGRYRLCGACYRHANPPPIADPLDVTQPD